MTETVEQMAAEIVQREGGFSDHPADKGGPTMYGITQEVARRHGYLDVRFITPSIAAQIMIEDYLKAPGLDRVPAELQPQLFDISVNSGAKEAVLLLQHALVGLGYRVATDGVLGPETLAATRQAIEAVGWQSVENAIVASRVAFYRVLVNRNPAEEAFLKGWERRAESFEVPLPGAAG